MTIRQACFCGFTAVIALTGALVLMAVALDVVSVPTPMEVIHYAAR
jgi:hypothetical protein